MSWQHLSLLPTILSDLQVGLCSNRRPVLGIIDYQHCYQLFLHWRLKLLIQLSYLILLSSVHSRYKFKALITKKHKAIAFPNQFIKFPYNWDNVIHVIKKMYSKIKFKDSKCDIYTMAYISQSLIYCSKGNLECVLKCTKFPEKWQCIYV